MHRFQETEDIYRISSHIPERLNFFKFEHSGMLVYDSKANVVRSSQSDNNFKPTKDLPKLITAKVKKDLEFANADGKCYLEVKRYKSMRDYPPDPSFQPEYTLEIPNDEITLRFNSKFESGNLYKAIKLSDYDYHLYIFNDTGTYNQNHWYYFSAVNPRKTSITFSIVNIHKKDYLYLSGMQPAVYSTKLSSSQGIKWHRDGTNIKYTENHPIGTSNSFAQQKFYTLSFTYSYKYENDEVFFAYSIPYTYTDLVRYLDNIQKNYSDIVYKSSFCKTIAGNKCYSLLITENIKSYRTTEKKSSLSDKTPKKSIVLMGRVHSGETVSSYMVKGAIDYLISPEAKGLRQNYVFCIIPMLNPDGVKYGNYRTSLLGVDLNRRWKEPNKILHPTIYYTKRLIEQILGRHEIMMICDMHGHTKKKNVFMYGCSVSSQEQADKEKNLLARVIPYQMHNKNRFFSFNDSHFRIEKYKESTARIVMFQEYNIVHSYTMEASFFGPSSPNAFAEKFRGDMHFSLNDLESLGRDLCKCCHNFNSHQCYAKNVRQTNLFLQLHLENIISQKLVKDQESAKVNIIHDDFELIEEHKEDSISLKDEIEVIIKEKLCEKIFVVDIGVDPESSGSDSEPSDGEGNRSCSVKKPIKISLTKTQANKITPASSNNGNLTTQSIRTVKNTKRFRQIETGWSVKRKLKSPIDSTTPQEIVAPQSFNFTCQTRFNPFHLEVKLRSEVPELDLKQKLPKFSKAEKPSLIVHKPKKSSPFVPAFLSVNLPNIQSSVDKLQQKHQKTSSETKTPREIFHIGSASFSEMD